MTAAGTDRGGHTHTHKKNFTSQKVTGRPLRHLLYIYFWICSEPFSDQVQKWDLRLKQKTKKSKEPIVGSIREKIVSSGKTLKVTERRSGQCEKKNERAERAAVRVSFWLQLEDMMTAKK